MNITDITLCPVPKAKARYRGDNFTVAFKVDGRPLTGTLHLSRDDGSIKKDIGKWYISIEIGEDVSEGHGSGDCPKCASELAKPLLDAFKAVLPSRYKLAKWSHGYHGWYLFCHHVKNTGEYQTVGHRHCSPEVVAIYLEAPAKCPIHGKVFTQDTDVAD